MVRVRASMGVRLLAEVMAVVEVVVVEAVVIMVVVVVVVVEGLLLAVAQIRPDEPVNISVLSAFHVAHAPQSVCANDDAPENMPRMVVTLETSHLYRSPFNDVAARNMSRILVTLDTSH